MGASLGLAIFQFLNKVAPWLMAAVIWWKAGQAKEKEIALNNAELGKEYEEIRADKSGTIDDDVKRMQDGTF